MKVILIVINLLMISSLLGQSLCDTSANPIIFTYLKEMPSSNITFDQLEDILNKSIDLKENNLSEGDIIYLTFLINCKGEDFDYKIINLDNDALQKSLIQILQDNLEWSQPIIYYKSAQGEEKIKAVDFSMNLKIIIEKNQLQIIDSNSTKKKKKRK